MLQYTYEKPEKTSKLPIDYQPTMMQSNLDKGFDFDEIKKLTEYNLVKTSDVLKEYIAGNIDINDYNTNIGKILKTLGQKKGSLTKVKGIIKSKNIDQINQLTNDEYKNTEVETKYRSKNRW